MYVYHRLPDAICAYSTNKYQAFAIFCGRKLFFADVTLRGVHVCHLLPDGIWVCSTLWYQAFAIFCGGKLFLQILH